MNLRSSYWQRPVNNKSLCGRAFGIILKYDVTNNKKKGVVWNNDNVRVNFSQDFKVAKVATSLELEGMKSCDIHNVFSLEKQTNLN